jgi:hypothetical protein
LAALAKVAARIVAWRTGLLILRVSGGRQPPRPLLRLLRFGWGNPGYVADLPYLDEVVRRVRRGAGGVLEAGSGLTTVIISYVLPANRHFLALEHQEKWANRVNRFCRPGTAPVAVAPLVSYGDYDWYQPAPGSLPHSLELIICDGPPGSTRGGRYGVVPVLASLMSEHVTLLLDDADRSGERWALERWSSEFGAEYSFPTTPGRAYAEVSFLDLATGMRGESEKKRA